MRYAILLIGLLLAFGCISSPSQPAQPAPQPNATPPAANNTTAPPPMSCNDYCVTLPHVQCEGSWQISGTYPSCVCTFECAQNTTNQTQPAPQPTPQPQPLGTPTNKTVDQMLSDAMSAQRTSFYRYATGTFDEKSYTWERVVNQSAGGGIPIGPGPNPNDVLFDNQSVSSIMASGFYLFTNKDTDAQTALGVSIFQARTTPLDSFTASDNFSVSYFPSMIAYNLSSCSITTKDYEYDPQNNWFVIYKYTCGEAIQK